MIVARMLQAGVFGLALVAPSTGSAGIGTLLGLPPDDREAAELIMETPDKRKVIELVEADAKAIVDALTGELTAQIELGCTVPLLRDPFNLQEACTKPLPGRPPRATKFVKEMDIKSKNQRWALWPGNRERLLQAFAAQVLPLARRDFPTNYNVGAAPSSIDARESYRSSEWDVDVHGTEFLLRDGRTVLSVRSETRRRLTSVVYGEKLYGGWFNARLDVVLLDVRTLPARWVISAPDGEGSRMIIAKVGDDPVSNALRGWGMGLGERRVDASLLAPGDVPALDPNLRDFGLALAEQRWSRLQQQIDSSRDALAAGRREANSIGQAERHAGNREVRAERARDRAAILSGLAMGAQNFARDTARREAGFAAIRDQAARFHGASSASTDMERFASKAATVSRSTSTPYARAPSVAPTSASQASIAQAPGAASAGSVPSASTASSPQTRGAGWCASTTLKSSSSVLDACLDRSFASGSGRYCRVWTYPASSSPGSCEDFSKLERLAEATFFGAASKDFMGGAYGNPANGDNTARIPLCAGPAAVGQVSRHSYLSVRCERVRLEGPTRGEYRVNGTGPGAACVVEVSYTCGR